MGSRRLSFGPNSPGEGWDVLSLSGLQAGDTPTTHSSGPGRPLRPGARPSQRSEELGRQRLSVFSIERTPEEQLRALSGKGFKEENK